MEVPLKMLKKASSKYSWPGGCGGDLPDSQSPFGLPYTETKKCRKVTTEKDRVVESAHFSLVLFFFLGGGVLLTLLSDYRSMFILSI